MSQFELSRQVRFEAAHFLPKTPEGHKCRRLHGHSFAAEIWVTGPFNEQAGWVVDFSDLGNALAPIRDTLDHRLLNDIDGLENPTSEELARWLWRRCCEVLPAKIQPTKISLKETCESGLIYRG